MTDRLYDTVLYALTEGLWSESVSLPATELDRVTRRIVAALQGGDFDPSLVPVPDPEPPIEPFQMGRKWWYEEPGFEDFHGYLKDLAERTIREYVEKPLPRLSGVAKHHKVSVDGTVTFKFSQEG